MSAIQYVLSMLPYKISPRLLDIAFKETDKHDLFPSSLSDKIKNTILVNRVLVDCNLVGGQEILIQLDDIRPDYVDNFNLVYRIPLSKTLNRKIISVLSVGYLPIINGIGMSVAGYMPTMGANTSEISNIAMRIHDSNAAIPPISNANVEIIADNTILIRDQLSTTRMYSLRCRVGNDEDLANINQRMYIPFLELCTLATKSYIYNKLLVEIDVNYLLQGQELGIIKTIVESYSDTEEQYITFLKEKWGKIAIMNDSVANTRLMRLQLSSQM